MARRRRFILGGFVLVGVLGCVGLGVVLSRRLLPRLLRTQVTIPNSMMSGDPNRTGVRSFDMTTMLPRDAIPALDDPQFLSVEEANDQYEDDEMVVGVVFNGEARAYSIPELSRHEVANDTVGGVKIVVTW